MFKYDCRVSYNIDKTYQRPYVGVLFEIEEKKYFAPLTSSNKGKKLKDNPKGENLTFFPLDKCNLGGINLNNMIPVLDGVYKKFDINNEKNLKKKTLLIKQVIELRKKSDYIIKKAKKLYGLKISGRLYASKDNITCDFKLLESIIHLYN